MLDDFIKAGQLARQLEIRSVPDFILKNDLNISRELAILVTEQYTFREKLRDKVPEWYANQELIGPKKVSVEQSSSAFTAKFKADLFHGKKGIDLTGGMGVDAGFLSRSFGEFIYNEADTDLTDIARYNFEQLGFRNVSFRNSNAIDLAAGLDEDFDLIYLDPARRDKENKKVIRIEDCEPNLVAFKEILLSKCKYLMVKYSPLLDIKAALKSLENVSQVKILAERNEVKELLFILEQHVRREPEITCINGLTEGGIQTFSFTFDEEVSERIEYKIPEKYLYEPNAAIMKGGAFKSVGKRFGLTKVSPNSHLYSAPDLIEAFPGRTFRIRHKCQFDKKEIRKHLHDNKANVSSRNFPLKPEEIKIKIGLKDGGNDYIFFTQDVNNKKIVLICDKIAS